MVRFEIDNKAFSTNPPQPNLYKIDIKLAYGGEDGTTADDKEFDLEAFEFEVNTGVTPNAPYTTTTLPSNRADKIIKCQNDQIFCAIAEMRTNVLKHVK